MTDCFNILKDLTGDKLSDEDLTEIITTLERERDALRAAGKIAEADDLVRQSAINMGDAELIAKKREQYAAYKNVLVKRDIMTRVLEADAMKDDPSLGLRSVIYGVNAPIENARYSVDSLGIALSQEAQGGLMNDLKAAGLLTQFNSMKGDFEDEVARAIYALASPEGSTVRATTKVSAEAMEIAKIMHKYNELTRNRLNAEGAFVRKRSGFIVSRSHDQWIIRKAGADKWKNDVRERLDFDKMGIRPDEQEKFLDSVYEALSSGVRLDHIATMTESEVKKLNDIFSKAFKGSQNVARKVSQSRVLEFKTPADDMFYNRTYGGGSLRESFIGSIAQSSKQVAAMRIMGHNPEAMYKAIRETIEKKYRGDTKKLDKLRGGVVNLDHAMDELTGKVNMVETTSQARWADISAGTSLIQSMAKLGSSILAVIPDLGLHSAARQYHGRSLMGAWSDTFLAPLDGLSPKLRAEVADKWAAGIDGMIGSMLSRYNATDHFSGRMAKTAQTFFKLNLMTPYTDMMQRGNTIIMARDLGDMAAFRFADLPMEKQRLLKIYGLTEKHWEIARQNVGTVDGKKYLMPGDVEDARGAVFTGMSQAQQRKLRSEVQDRLYTLMKSEAEMSIIEPGMGERAMLRRGTTRGSAAGIAMRQMALFKSFGVTVVSKGYGRQIYGHAGTKTLGDVFRRGMGANAGLVNLVVSTTVLGYVSLQLKEIAKGRKPRPTFEPETFFAAMMQGGGAGIFGDFLFAEYNRFGGGALETLAGPTIGTFSQAINTFQKARTRATAGEPIDLGGDLIRLAKGNIPLANLLYTKMAMDYLVWYQLQESINPGYLRRMERRIERENNQEFWLPPTSVVK